MMEALPVARELIADLCAYDLVGFQTEEHARDFRDCAQRMLGATVQGEWVRLNGRSMRAFADPIGIDAEVLPARTPTARSTTSWCSALPAAWPAARSRSASTAWTIPRACRSASRRYARLLEKHPEHRRKVHFLQICPRSREEVDEYRKLRAELDRLAGRINGRFSEFDWTPLRYSTRAAPRTTLAGLYRIGRIGVVTPLRDGMNLVAKEFVAAQTDDDPGVLVLSQFAGAAHELTEALIVNPFDPDAIADAMHLALSMPTPERRERHLALKEKVLRTTAQAYCQHFMEALSQVKAQSVPRAAA